MNLIDSFRNPQHIKTLLKAIHEQSKTHIKILEVCGGHTHTIMKNALPQLLPSTIEFVHGPGCPVCIMPRERIDAAIALANEDGVILATLGDMIRVPGSKTSLQKLRASGKDIRALYSPLDLLKIAKDNPSKKVVFFAIGFETTTPMSASVMKMAQEMGIKNLYFHINHVLVPEVMEHLLKDNNAKLDAFLGPSHVSVITGSDIFKPLCEKYKKPIVIAGFEPSDVLESVLMIVRQINEGKNEVQNQYTRAVSPKGNQKAQNLINHFMQKRDTFIWRGLGEVPKSALRLKDEFAYMDAENVFSSILPKEHVKDSKACICGSILKGVAKPFECKVFANKCTPNTPIGSCMVSSEGACAAYYKYMRK